MKFLIYILLVILASCKPAAPLQHTISRTDSVIIRERLVPIKIESTSVKKSFSKAQVDSIITALKNLPANSRTIYHTDPKLKTQLSFALDSIGNLVVQCKTLEALYWEKLKEKDRIIEKKELEIREKEKTIFQKIERTAKIIGGSLLAILIGLFTIVIYIYRKFKPNVSILP